VVITDWYLVPFRPDSIASSSHPSDEVDVVLRGLPGKGDEQERLHIELITDNDRRALARLIAPLTSRFRHPGQGLPGDPRGRRRQRDLLNCRCNRFGLHRKSNRRQHDQSRNRDR
jgi:hypothetical protein